MSDAGSLPTTGNFDESRLSSEDGQLSSFIPRTDRHDLLAVMADKPIQSFGQVIGNDKDGDDTGKEASDKDGDNGGKFVEEDIVIRTGERGGDDLKVVRPEDEDVL